MRYQVAVTFAIDGDLRFISHLDTLRLFARAAARAELPVRFSEGFNPQPKLRLPLPRPVGMASDHEMLTIEFTEPVTPDLVREKLLPQMPDGILLTDVKSWPAVALPQPVEASYRLDVASEDISRLEQAAEHLLRADSLQILRSCGPGKTSKTVDIRKTIARIKIHADHIELALTVRPEGGARAVEVFEVLGFDPKAVAHRVRRTQTEWSAG